MADVEESRNEEEKEMGEESHMKDSPPTASEKDFIRNESDQQNASETPISSSSLTYRTASEYAAAVNQWLWQCYYWQCFSTFLPYAIMQQSVCQNQPSSSTPGTTDFNRNFPSTFFPNQNFYAPVPTGVAPPQQYNVQGRPPTAQEHQGREFLIPPLWKRFAAETIDFVILLLLKVMVTYIAVDFFEIVNLDKYDLDLLRDEKIDYRIAIEVTSEILTLEIIHRFVVCLFEALCLHRGTLGPGGATPGKSMLRLKVVSCRTIVQIDTNRVRVYPAGDIGFGWALLRAFIKNFSLAFIFPIFFTMFFFQHNRTAYDIICSSIVVEDLPRIDGRN